MVALCRFIPQEKTWQLCQICPQPASMSHHFLKPKWSGGDCKQQSGEPQYVSKRFWANERTGTPQLLKLGQRNSQFQWKTSLRPHVPGVHMCKTNSTNKQNWCCAKQCPLSGIKQTANNRTFSGPTLQWGRDSVFTKNIHLNFRGTEEKVWV